MKRTPGWLSKCRSILEGLHQDRVEKESPLTLTWGIANEGTRPAVHMRVAFVAQGSIRLRRRSEGGEDGSDTSDTNDEMGHHTLPRLPPPPKPPQVRRIVKRPQAASGRPGAAVQSSLSGLQMGDLSRIASIGTAVAELTRAAGVLSPDRELLDTVLGELTEPKVVGVPHSLDVAPLHDSLLRAKHDKEAFYYDDWPADEGVVSGALTCDLYRHQNGEDLFEIDVLFPPDGDVRGAVVCTVHAENLTEPVSVRIPVNRCIEEYSLLEQAQALVDNCGHRD